MDKTQESRRPLNASPLQVQILAMNYRLPPEERFYTLVRINQEMMAKDRQIHEVQANLDQEEQRAWLSCVASFRVIHDNKRAIQMVLQFAISWSIDVFLYKQIPPQSAPPFSGSQSSNTS